MTEIGPVNIQLTASGISEVMNAFKSVEDRCVALERKLDQISQGGARKRTKTAKDEAAAKAKESDNEAKAAERAEQDKTKAAEKWAKQRERIVHNSAMYAGRLAKQQADAEIRESERSANARARHAKQLAGSIINNFRSTLGHATSMFGSLMALGGGLSVGSAFSNEMKIGKSAMALEIASDVPGKPDQKISAASATAAARKMSLEYGVSAADVLETQHAIIAKTGRGKESQVLTEAAMRIGTAEGADPKELGQAVAAAMAQNPNLTTTEGVNLMKMMVDQGKVGAIEIKDMSKILPVLTKTAVLYGGKQSDNQAKLVTMVQHAITTTGGPEQAAVAVARFSDWMSSKKGAKALGGRGFNVFDSQGQLKSVDELMKGVLTHGGNTAQGLGQMGMEGKAKSLVEAFTGVYNAALKEGKTKEQAAELAMKTYKEELGMRITDAKLDSDLKKVQSTDAFKVSQNMEKLNQAIGMKLAPVLTELIGKIGDHANEIAEFMEKIAGWIKWASENPWSAVGIAAAAAITKSILAEVAASGLKNILARAFTGGGGGVPGGPGVVGGPGTFGAVAAGLTIGVGTGLAVISNTESILDRDKKSLVEKQNRANELMTKLGPDAKPEDVAAAKATLAALDKQIEEQKSFFGRTWGAVGKGAGYITGEKGSEASDLLNFVPLFAAYQGLLGGSSFGGAEGQAELAETQRDQLKKAIDAHEKNSTSTESNTAAINALTNKLDNLRVGSGFGGGGSDHASPNRDSKGNIIPDKKTTDW